MRNAESTKTQQREQAQGALRRPRKMAARHWSVGRVSVSVRVIAAVADIVAGVP